VDWLFHAQHRARVNTVMNIRVLIKCLEVLEWLHNWRILKEEFSSVSKLNLEGYMRRRQKQLGILIRARTQDRHVECQL
jgi:hypothetical protein